MHAHGLKLQIIMDSLSNQAYIYIYIASKVVGSYHCLLQMS
jgi:hypothetical protein